MVMVMVTTTSIPARAAGDTHRLGKLTRSLCKDSFACDGRARALLRPDDRAHRPARDARLRAPGAHGAARPAADARADDRHAGRRAAGGELGHVLVPLPPAREVRLRRGGGRRQGPPEAVA